MNEFIELVREMRNAQKEYFKTRDKDVLLKSKELECKVDSFFGTASDKPTNNTILMNEIPAENLLPQGLQDMLSAHRKYTAQANDINNEIIDRKIKASDWVSVEDRLPILGKRVMVCQQFNDGSTFVRMATRVQINQMDRWYNDDGFDLEYISHWQKIVLPKKEKK